MYTGGMHKAAFIIQIVAALLGSRTIQPAEAVAKARKLADEMGDLLFNEEDPVWIRLIDSHISMHVQSLNTRLQQAEALIGRLETSVVELQAKIPAQSDTE